MRSTVLTFLLVLLASALCTLVGWRLTHGNLDVLFGSQPVKPGEALFSGFKDSDVRRMTLSRPGVSDAKFVLDEHMGWRADGPGGDRMDPYYAAEIIAFTVTTHVAEVIPRDKIAPKQAGFTGEGITVTLEGAGGEQLCKYLLGRKTAWIGEDPTSHEEVPTVFIHRLDKNRKNYIYACTGDIHLAFRDGFRYLRDHQPFLFRPQQLDRIHIRTTAGELTVARAAPDAPWRIIKPLDLPIDREAMVHLIEGLDKLRASKVSNRADVTVPATGNAAGSEQIAIHFFGAPEETVLEILPPQTADAVTRLATVSDRPNAVFELPAKSENSMISLSSLPLTVNDLRDKTLTNLNIGAVTGILIQPAGRPEILLTRKPGKWVMGQGETQQPANDHRLFDLLQAVSVAKVAAFVTDAATDFSQWGLDHPFLTLRFMAGEVQSLELSFGRDKSGGVFVNRRGTTSVMRINDDILARIATQAYEWRGSKLWDLNSQDLDSISRNIRGKSLIKLTYEQDAAIQWKAERNHREASTDLNRGRADHFLEDLEKLEVNRWLPMDDQAADAALLNPVMVLRIETRRVDPATSDPLPSEAFELKVAPAVEGATNRFYYGSVSSNPNPFLLDLETVTKLVAKGLFDDEN